MHKFLLIAILVLVLVALVYYLKPKYSLTKVLYGTQAQISAGTAQDVTKAISALFNPKTGVINETVGWWLDPAIGDPAPGLSKMGLISYNKKFKALTYSYSGTDSNVQTPLQLP